MKTSKLLILQSFLLLLFFSCKEEDLPNQNDDTLSDQLDTTVPLVVHEYTKNDGPDKNPMKGWNSGWWNENDLATVGFQYIGWKDLEPVDDEFNFEKVEQIINRSGTKNKHLVLRLFTDWYGDNLESAAGPAWLYDDLGVERLQGPNGRYVTDYNNENYINEAIEAIGALAAHYDNDPRIFSFQIGVLGYWGEWHNAGFNGDFNMSQTTRNQILDAYKENFSNAKIMGRYPWREPLMSTGGIGFHNDFFGPSGHSNEFDEAIQESSMYLDGPIGGEAPPDVSEEDFAIMMTSGSGMDMIEKGHYSVMLGKRSPCDSSPDGADCEGYMAINRKMGYNYQIETATFPEVLSQNDNLAIDLLLSNIGVAPIYYQWEIQFALMNLDGEVIKTIESDHDLTSLLPEEQVNIVVANPMNDIAEGVYILGIRIIQPEADDSKAEQWKLDARNTYILFSNEMEETEGVWNDDNALSGGWSTLGEIEVTL